MLICNRKTDKKKRMGVGIIEAITRRLYAQFAKDIREGTNLTPDFAHDPAHHQLLDAIETSSRTGMAQKLEYVMDDFSI